MTRWVLVLLLGAAAVATTQFSRGHLAPRGLRLEVWENLRWSGDSVVDEIVRHPSYAPESALHARVLPNRSSLQLTGWIFAPRAGKYEFAVISTDRAWLRIDGDVVVSHRPQKADATARRHMLAKGFHRLRVQVRHQTGDAKLQLKWRLPSGYMNLESIPPAFMQPDVPKPTELPLPLRLGPVLLFSLFGLALFWPTVKRTVAGVFATRNRSALFIGVVLVVAGLGLRLYDLNAAGETSDEWAYASAGRIYITNLAHGDLQSEYWNANEEHPPVGKYLYGLVSHLAGSDSYSPLRAASAVFNVIVILITFVMGARYFGLGVGTFAGGLLVVLPHFLAHGKVAALDSPSTMLATACIALFFRGLEGGRRANRWYLASGVFGCLAFSTKFSNVLLFVFMVFAHLVSQWRRLRRQGAVELPWSLFVLPLLPLTLLVAMWPWLWDNPFGQLVATLTHWDYPIREWFLGRYQQPPPHYFPVYFAVTMPGLLLIPFVVALGRSRWLTDVSKADRTERYWVALTVVWFLTPFIWTLSVLKQDGIRYIYNMFPPLALLLGIGAREIARWVAARGDWRLVRIQSAVTAVLLAYTGWQASTVHPYYLDYYAEWVGGTYSSWENRRFEVGWWGEGMNLAVDYVNEHADAGDTWDCFGVVSHTVDGIRTDIERKAKRPEWLIVGYVQSGNERRKGYEEVYRVSLHRAPLAIVYRRK